MGTLIVIAIVLFILCLCSSEKLNNIISVIICLAVVGGLIYGVKCLFGLSWGTTIMVGIIFILGSTVWNKIK